MATHQPNPTPSPNDQGIRRQRRKAAAAFIIFAILIAGVTMLTASIYQTVKSKQRANSHGPATAQAAVSITSSGFRPATIQVKPNTLVVWTNHDTRPHKLAAEPYPTHSGIPGFNSDVVLQKGESYSFVFKTGGTYHYDDYLHPYTLKGTVLVK